MGRKIHDISFFLKNFNFEQLYWYFEFGPSRQKISPDELKNSLHKIDRPVFFLSTGRTGTAWLADLFSGDRGIKAFHAPSPDLATQNLYAYRLQMDKNHKKEEVDEILSQIFMAGRENYLRYSYKCQRRYLETNNHITFFAPTIAGLLPKARFIHIRRHPGDFVSSGLKRNWFRQEGKELRQIVPMQGHDKDAWPDYTPITKIGWLWKETNSYIETFKESLSPDRTFTFDFSSMNLDSLRELMQFTDSRINEKQIRKKINRRLNKQQYSASEKYTNWTDGDKALLAEVCDPLASKYQYKL
jgi:hypothetical protein